MSGGSPAYGTLVGLCAFMTYSASGARYIAFSTGEV